MPYYDLTGKITVIIDVLRASSVICTALDEGVKSIIPVADLENAKRYKDNGYYIAAERKGEKVQGADIGNSPSEFFNRKFEGKSIVLTTSNGTQALKKATNGVNQVYIGCFLNANKIVETLKNAHHSAILVCAGWRNYFNMEDSLFAGYLALHLESHFSLASDAALGMKSLYEAKQNDFKSYLSQASHAQRLKKLDNQADLDYCLTPNKHNVLPFYHNGELIIKNEN